MDNNDNICKPLGPLAILFISILIGGIASIGAVFLRALIAFFHNLLFFGRITSLYDANLHTPVSPWGPLVILVPVVGAFGVAFLVKNFAPEAKGHGVPEVMDAIYYKNGIIRPVVALIKSLASALSIGSGASIGREGPIVQIGSAFGSTMGQILNVPAWQRITMLAAGAGAGIAATFNTPVGGVLFAVELLLHEVSVKTLVPVAIAAATATYLGQIFFGAHPSFVIPAFENPYFKLTSPMVLLSYTGLGMIMGLMSTLYIRTIYSFEDLFEKWIPTSYYARHMFGMLLSGMIMYLLMVTSGHYYIDGIGYATVQDVLSGNFPTLILLLILCALKLLATSLALGSGASGGIFSPALFIGATLGGAYGLLLHQLFPGYEISPPAFAVAGMAGLVGGATGAAITAIIMILEMTYDYSVVIPITITVAFSYGMRALLVKESIYTMKLVRRGHYMPESLHSNIHKMKRARDFMDRQFLIVPASTTFDALARIAAERGDIRWLLREEAGQITAALTREDVAILLAEKDEHPAVGEIRRKGFVTLGEDATLIDILARMRVSEASIALIMKGGATAVPDGLAGVISKEMAADAMADVFSLFSDHPQG